VARRATTEPRTPPARRRGPRKGDLKEAAILDTAWRLLATKPLSLITTEDLASGAGISRSSFYFYFDSKEAVIITLADRVAAEIREATAAFFEVRVDASPAELRRGVASYIERWKEKGPLLRSMYTLGEADESLRQFWDEVTEELLGSIATVIEVLRTKGLAPPGPPDAHDLVRVLFAMLWRTGYDISLGRFSPDEEQRLIDTLTRVCYTAVFGPEP